MNRLSIAVGAAALVCGMGIVGSASAVVSTRDYLSHGNANCHSALPVFDANMRHRPMAFANDSTTASAFVTCDTEHMDNSNGAKFSAVGVYFTNRSSATTSVNCTLVTGLVPFVTVKFYPKVSTSMPPGVNGLVAWDVSDNAFVKFGFPTVSCNLPPSVEINIMRFEFEEEIGA